MRSAAGWTRLDGAGEHRTTSSLGQLFSKLEVAEATAKDLRDLRRSALTQEQIYGGSGLRPVAPKDASAEQTSDETYLVAAQDLDGDGTTESLTSEFVYAGVDLEDQLSWDYPPFDLVMRGYDGHALWRRSTGYVAALEIQDLTGDGRPEILLAEDTSNYKGAGALVAAAAAGALGTRIVALDAMTGAPLWTSENAGTVVYGGTLVVGVEALQNYVYSVQTSADLDGDGGRDVFVGSLSGAVGYGSAVAVAAEAGRFTVSGSFISGKAGATIAGVETSQPLAEGCAIGAGCAGAEGVPWIGPAGDVTGDGKPDVVTRAVRDALIGPEIFVSAADGSAEAWSAPAGPYDFASSFELNGDGRADVLVTDYYGTGAERALDGKSGAQLWEVACCNVFVWDLAVTADLDGDGGHDFLAITEEFRKNKFIYLWRAVSGADGHSIWKKRIPFRSLSYPDADTGVYVCTCHVDLDGDAAIDDMIAIIPVNEDFEALAIDFLGLNGRTGTFMWSYSAGPTDPFPYPMYAASGPSDLIEAEAGPGGVDVTTRSGATALPKFTGHVPIPELAEYQQAYAYAWGAAASFGLAGEGVVASIGVEGCGEDSCYYEARVRALTATDVLWTV